MFNILRIIYFTAILLRKRRMEKKNRLTTKEVAWKFASEPRLMRNKSGGRLDCAAVNSLPRKTKVIQQTERDIQMELLRVNFLSGIKNKAIAFLYDNVPADWDHVFGSKVINSLKKNGSLFRLMDFAFS